MAASARFTRVARWMALKPPSPRTRCRTTRALCRQPISIEAVTGSPRRAGSSLRRPHGLEVPVVEFDAVVIGTDPHPLIPAVCPNIVLINGDSVDTIAWQASGNSVNTIGRPGFHVGN